jgi:glycosyltransferase involved in cell wall biosynthesis
MSEVHKKVKILSIYRSKLEYQRGTPLRIKNLLKRLNTFDDIDLTLCSWDEQSPEGLQHFHLTNHHWQDIQKIRRFVQKEGIDIIIGHTMATWYYLLYLKLFTPAKIVLEMHGFIEEEALFCEGAKVTIKARLWYWLNKIVYSWFYPTCDLITTCSETATKILSRYNKKVFTIFGGADVSLFNPQVPSKAMIKKEGIIIGYAGNTMIWQGIDFLVEVYKELIQQYPEFKLKTLTSKKSKWEHEPTVENFGPVQQEEVPQFLIDCDILVIPRLDNTVNRISFASKLPEYMAMGKPVISSITSDADKVITHGYDGLLYQPGDKNGLKNCLLDLRDASKRAIIGQHAYETVLARFSWDQQAKAFHNYLLALIAQ